MEEQDDGNIACIAMEKLGDGFLYEKMVYIPALYIAQGINLCKNTSLSPCCLYP